MVAGNTILRLIGLAPDTYFFVVLALLCLAFIGGRLLLISRHLKNLNNLFKSDPGKKPADHGTAHHSSETAIVSPDGPTRRRSNSGRTYPHRRAAKFASRRAVQATRQS